MVAMVNLSGTAGPISIKCGQAGAELRRLMPTQTDRKERLLRHAGWVDGGERRRKGEAGEDRERGKRRRDRGEERGGRRGEQRGGKRHNDERMTHEKVTRQKYVKTWIV